MKIALTKGFFAQINKRDFKRVSVYKWYAHWTGKRWYAYGRVGQRLTYLHRFILRARKGKQIDHRNSDGLDCRRRNLRLATSYQNSANSFKKGPQKYKGTKLIKLKSRTKWQASICFNYNKKYIGLFDTAEQAALAYNAAAKKHFGEFARLNVLRKAQE